MPNSASNAAPPHGRDYASLDIFNPPKLRSASEDDVDRAVKTLEDYLGDGSIGTILQLSLQSPHHAVFGFILSSMPTSFLPAPPHSL
jgi:hypothetical protein